MSWWQTALSVAGTIGKVAGVLAGAAGDKAVFFRLTTSEEDYATVAFRKVNNTIVAYNQSADNAVQLAFDTDCARGPAGAGLVLTLAPFTSLDVTQAFATMAADDFDAFTVRPSGSLNATALDGTPPTASIEARATNLPASGNVSIGSFFNVSVNASDRTLQIAIVGGFVLAGLVLLDVRGAGRTFCRITNIMKGKKSGEEADVDDNSITVTIPPSVDIDSGITAIDIVAAVSSSSYQKYLHAHVREGKLQPISSEEKAELATLVPIG